MIEFRQTAQQRIIQLLTPVVGAGSDPIDYVKTFTDHIWDFQVAQLPALIVTIRTVEKLLPGEIGNTYNKYTWTAHIYYLDMDVSPTDAYDVGAARRDRIAGKIERTLEEQKFLADPLTNIPLMTTDIDGHWEKVYDSAVQTLTFDESGEISNQSFTTELFFEMYTDRS